MKALASTALTLAAVLLAACQSAAPIRYYTLLPSASRASAPAQDAAFRIDLAAVAIPAQVDTPRLVIREGAGRLQPVEGQRWIAPLADEARAALSAALTQALGVPDIGQTGGSHDALPVIRVRVELNRFESVLGRRAQIDATWTLSRTGSAAQSATCDSRIGIAVAAGFEALAIGHQQALAQLASRIARGITALNAGPASNVCSAADAG